MHCTQLLLKKIPIEIMVNIQNIFIIPEVYISCVLYFITLINFTTLNTGIMFNFYYLKLFI